MKVLYANLRRERIEWQRTRAKTARFILIRGSSSLHRQSERSCNFGRVIETIRWEREREMSRGRREREKSSTRVKTKNLAYEGKLSILSKVRAREGSIRDSMYIHSFIRVVYTRKKKKLRKNNTRARALWESKVFFFARVYLLLLVWNRHCFYNELLPIGTHVTSQAWERTNRMRILYKIIINDQY